ncbi:hypothetical protein R6Q57_015453 [Mikania cordata]
MSGSRGSHRSRGSRGRVPFQGDRSGMRQLRDSESPATSDGTNMQGVIREHAYHQHMQTLVDHEDDDYEQVLGDIDGNEDGDGDGDGDDDGDDIDYHDMHDSMSIDDASHASQRPFISRIGNGDIMLGLRKLSLNYALKAGHDITISDPEVFNVIRNFPPDLVAQNIWNTEDWRKKSTSRKDNHNKTDRGGKTSRHTGGSIGYDKRRLRLESYSHTHVVKLGKELTFLELLLDIHISKKCKKIFWAGEPNVKILEGLQFCTEWAKEAYVTEYLQEMIKEYRLNFTQDDARVWQRLHGNGGPKRVFGIGLSDSDFVVTGTPSSSYGSTLSYVDKQAQQKLEDLEAQLEIERKAREELEEQMKKMNEFMKKFTPPDN